MDTLLLLDDEENLRKLLARMLELEGYTVIQASRAQDGLQVLQRDNIQVVISDVRLPDANGVELTAQIKQLFPTVEIVVLTAYGTIEDGVKAIKNGAFDYLTKGDHQEKILPLISRACEKARLRQRVHNLQLQLQRKHGFAAILGSSRSLHEAVHLAQKVAPTDTTVLLQGETGTGKEVFAQAIHYESTRQTQPFVALNCSAFPKDLLESELFGHAAGAFTGATQAKKGYVEEANNGTLFLDEIGELNGDLQAKLLRILETGEFYRLGDPKPRRVNVRFIAATNRNLHQEIEAGRFREDLFYRLSVFTITLPPLRERREDIDILVQHFIKQFAAKTNKTAPSVQPAFIHALRNYPWKGNIRELKNVIERCIILSDDALTVSLLPPDFHSSPDDPLDLQSVEKAHIRRVLALTAGNKTQAAKILGIGLTTLYQKIKDYQL